MGNVSPVVVVGAASGIGAAVLARHVERGAEVFALDYVKPGEHDD